MNILRHALSAAVAAALLSGASASAFAEAYRVDILPQAPDLYGGTLPTTAAHINNNGEAVGSTSVGESGTGTVYWGADGQVTNLTPGDYPASVTAGISDAGTAVYSDSNFGGPFYAWNAGTTTDLGAGYASAVNGKGQIAGTFGGIFGIWSDGVVSALPLPTPGTYASAYAINNNGDVVGTAYFPDASAYRAAVWRNGTVQQIGTLPGDVNSYPYAINDAGQVAGASLSSTNKWRAFLWDDGAISDLGIAGDAQSFALGINNAGQVVGGAAASGASGSHPFVWQNGVRRDLSAVVGDGSCSAYGINDSGALIANCAAIVGSGPAALRLTPVASSADLSVSFSATPTPVPVGVPLVYTATVANIGNATAAGATLTQTLPAGGFTIGAITTSKGSCSGSGIVTCAFGDLAPGAGAVVTITATPLPIVGVADYFDASVVTATSSPEVNAVNNAQKLHFSVFQNNAALSVHSLNSQTAAKKGANITYTWEVSNGGPLAAANVVLADTLPSSLAFVSATTTAGSCTGTVAVKCNLGDQKYGPITVTIVARAKAAGTIVNRATVTSTTPDSYAGDNTASVTTKVK